MLKTLFLTCTSHGPGNFYSSHSNLINHNQLEQQGKNKEHRAHCKGSATFLLYAGYPLGAPRVEDILLADQELRDAKQASLADDPASQVSS